MIPIELHFKYDQAYHVEATLEILKSTNKRLFLFVGFARIILLISLVSFLFGLVQIDSLVKEPLKLIGLLLLIFMAISPYLTKRSLINKFKKHPFANGYLDIVFNEHNVEINMPGSTSTMNWDKFYQFKQIKSGFLLFLQANIAVWVPFKEFKNENDINAVKMKLKYSEKK